MVYQSLVCWINCLTVSTCPDLLTVQQPLYLPPSFKIHHRAITPPLFTHFTAPFPHRHMAFIFNWMPMPSWNNSSVFHTPTINRLTPAPPPRRNGEIKLENRFPMRLSSQTVVVPVVPGTTGHGKHGTHGHIHWLPLPLVTISRSLSGPRTHVRRPMQSQ